MTSHKSLSIGLLLSAFVLFGFSCNKQEPPAPQDPSAVEETTVEDVVKEKEEDKSPCKDDAWDCTQFSDCSAQGKQTRLCVIKDRNCANPDDVKPEAERTCTPDQDSEDEEKEEEDTVEEEVATVEEEVATVEEDEPIEETETTPPVEDVDPIQEVTPDPVVDPEPEIEEVPQPVVQSFNMTAKQWSFSPSTITVNVGDTVRLSIFSEDVTHGFALSQFGVSARLEPQKTVVVEFIADKAGTYTFFCSVSCGSGHSSMKGTLIVN